MTYQEAKQARDEAVARSKAASDALQSFPKGAMGLTPDAVKATPEYRAAKAAYTLAFANERGINAFMTANFNAEMRAERAARYG